MNQYNISKSAMSLMPMQFIQNAEGNFSMKITDPTYEKTVDLDVHMHHKDRDDLMEKNEKTAYQILEALIN